MKPIFAICGMNRERLVKLLCFQMEVGLSSDMSDDANQMMKWRPNEENS